MRLTIDNLDGLGAVDYTPALDASKRLTIERTLNQPSICHGLLCLAATSLAVPVRRGRVVVASDAGTALFTGYLATEPVPEYAGAASAGPVYRLAFSAVSDEWLLDRQATLPIATGSLGTPGGLVLAGLVQQTGSTGLSTSGLTASPANLRSVGVFEPEPAAVWSANAGAAAAAAYGAYRVVDGAAALTPVGSVNHTFTDGDGSVSAGALKSTSVKELANDVTVSGELEPWAYCTEIFEGDGTTSVFDLTDAPFQAKSGQRTPVDESFDTGSFNTRIWQAADPGSHLGFSAAGLNVTGGTGADGQTTLALLDALEMGGSLVLEAGSLTFGAGSDGVVCGVYEGTASRANCFAGYNVRQASGATVIVPFVDGAEVGTPYTLLAGHTYTLRLRLHCVEMQRVLQAYYATEWGSTGGGAVTQFGGGLVSAPMSVVFDLIDLGAASNTPATVLYDGTVASAPASCTFVPVNSLALVGTIGYVRVMQAGSAWVTSTPPGTATATRLIGVAGTGVDCKVSYSATAPKLTFFSGRIPVAGELIAVTYRGRQRSVARLEDAASVAAEAAGGAPGTARWLGKVLQPQARSSADCEAAASAILGFAANRAAAVSGSYATVNPLATGTDIWPGDVLSFVSNEATTNGIVRKVVVEDGGSRPESMTYRMAFANDWAEGLGLRLSESIAADAVLPPAALTAPGQVLENLQQLSVVGVSATTLTLNAGVAPPAGGGFEVRRRDNDFGPGVDQDLVLRSPVQSFSIPRASFEEAFYVRMYDGSTPPLYSRCSSVAITHVAVS